MVSVSTTVAGLPCGNVVVVPTVKMTPVPVSPLSPSGIPNAKLWSI